MYKSRTSLIYTFRVEEIFEFLSKSVHPTNVYGSYRLYEDKYISRYVHGTLLECCCNVLLIGVYILCIHYSDMNKAHVYTDTSS
jgi:hypothetical protein